MLNFFHKTHKIFKYIVKHYPCIGYKIRCVFIHPEGVLNKEDPSSYI